MHKGHLKFRVCSCRAPPDTAANPACRPPTRVETAGGQAHRAFSRPWPGQFQEHAHRMPASDFNDVPHPVLAIVGVDGGKAWNVIPDACEIRCGLRVMPDQDATSDAGGDPCEPWRMPWHRFRVGTGGLQRQPAAVYRRGYGPSTAWPARPSEQHGSIGVSLSAAMAATSRSWAWSACSGVPGSIEQAHQPDEFISLEQFNLRWFTLLAGVIERQCLRAGSQGVSARGHHSSRSWHGSIAAPSSAASK